MFTSITHTQIDTGTCTHVNVNAANLIVADNLCVFCSYQHCAAVSWKTASRHHPSSAAREVWYRRTYWNTLYPAWTCPVYITPSSVTKLTNNCYVSMNRQSVSLFLFVY